MTLFSELRGQDTQEHSQIFRLFCIPPQKTYLNQATQKNTCQYLTYCLKSTIPTPQKIFRSSLKSRVPAPSPPTWGTSISTRHRLQLRTLSNAILFIIGLRRAGIKNLVKYAILRVRKSLCLCILVPRATRLNLQLTSFVSRPRDQETTGSGDENAACVKGLCLRASENQANSSTSFKQRLWQRKMVSIEQN